MAIYDITEYQADNLKRMAKEPEYQPLIVVSTKPTDTDKVLKRLLSNKQDADDLVVLGILENRTSGMVEAVMGMEGKFGRPASFYYLTKIGATMFKSTHSKRKPN